MTYQESLDYLFNLRPAFERDGKSGYKPGLERVEKLAELMGNPHHNFTSIHIAGTNGKGSTAHTIAAVLQAAGYKVGLFTSPHLVDFRERIRVDGEMMPQADVVEFADLCQREDWGAEASFFELTTVLAFSYFAKMKVDVAVVEVGLGGRLDSTNIIMPRLSVITNISLDHTSLLGDSRQAIAYEKAGIIKPGVPVVIGEGDNEVSPVFNSVAVSKGAPIVYANAYRTYRSVVDMPDGGLYYFDTLFGDLHAELSGDCQKLNTATIITALQVLKGQGWNITDEAVARGFAEVCEMTGLAGRWMTISHEPLTICDTGHNPGGWQYLAPRLNAYGRKLKVVIGFAADKDIDSVLAMLPKQATYYFTQANTPRAIPSTDLYEMAQAHGLAGSHYPSVAEAVASANKNAEKDDVIFIGGSNFVVAEALA